VNLVAFVAAAALHALRLAPVALASPFLGGPLVPPVVRAALALGLGAAAAALTRAPAPEAGADLALAAFRELGLGTVLALLASVPIEAARAGGRLADTFRGATLSELHVAPIRQRESALGDLLAQWVIVLAAWAGADRLVLRAVLGSFAALPVGAPPPGPTLLAASLAASGEIVAVAVALAAPAAAGVLAADLAVGLAARVAPQLGAVNAAQPARAALGLVAVAAAASAAAGRLVALAAWPERLVLALGGAP
jgi:type III secretion protein T